MPIVTERRYLTVRETADLLAVSPLTVRRRIAGGELAAVRVGAGRRSPVRIPRGALDQLLRPAT